VLSLSPAQFSVYRFVTGTESEQVGMMSERSGWQLADASVAEANERYLMSTFGYAWAQALVQLAAPQEGDRLLDVACGTGPVARQAAPFVGPTGRVVGLDLNAGMLEIARSMPTPEGIWVEWRQGNATALPFQNASFDVVCCHQGLQFFPDRAAALGEMFRVLAPVGRLALAVWRGIEHHPFYAALAEALERYVSHEAAESLRAAFTLAHADQLRALVAGAGFRNVHIRIRNRLTRYPSLAEFVLGYVSGTPMADAVAALEEADRAAMVEQVCSTLGDHVDDDGMAAPWEAHFVTAKA
jgi:ubiquinone/menaquinone biosynthesis C-methylase UbiE